MAAEDESKAKEIEWGKIITCVFIMALGMILIPIGIGDSWEVRGQIGDMVGIINSMFSGLAFVGLLGTIVLQQRELGLQRQDLKLTRDEVRRSAEAQERSEEALRLQAASQKATAQINALGTLIRVNDHAREMERNVMHGMADEESQAEWREYIVRLKRILDSKPEGRPGWP